MANHAEDEKHQYLFVIGAPGAGKGTLCKRLARDHDFTHISVGDLLRKNADKNDVIKFHVDRGELLPSKYLFGLLRETFRTCRPGRPTILDGFPRRMDQAREFEEVFGRPHLVLFFQCPEALAKQRVVSRNEGRPADDSAGFDKRYQEYLKLNPAIVDYYDNDQGGNKLVEIDTSKGTDVSYGSLIKHLASLL